jgi:hypothetical protein
VLEAQIIDPIDRSQGFISAMGWMNCGDLVLDGATAIDTPNNEPGRHKQHSAKGTNQIWYCGTMATSDPIVRPNGRRDYPRWLTISTSIHNAWGGTESVSPFLSDLYFCRALGITDPTRCRINATTYRPHLIGFNGAGSQPIFAGLRAILDPDRDGWIDGTFYHNRYGVPRQSSDCSEPGLDCAPYTYRHVRLAGGPQCNDREQCGQMYRNHDVLFGNRTSGWNRPVN